SPQCSSEPGRATCYRPGQAAWPPPESAGGRGAPTPWPPASGRAGLVLLRLRTRAAERSAEEMPGSLPKAAHTALTSSIPPSWGSLPASFAKGRLEACPTASRSLLDQTLLVSTRSETGCDDAR